jgi:hypothetical protein
MSKTTRKYDDRTGVLHVWNSSIPVWVGAPRVKNEKSCDLDEVFGRKEKEEENVD